MDLRPLVHPRQTVAATVLAALAGLVAPAALAQNAYITNYGSDTVSVIDTATNGYVGSPIRVGDDPFGVAVTPDGSRVYVANQSSGTVSVIDTATNAVVGPAIQIGPSSIPVAFGLFIQPAEAQFAGTPGQKNCAARVPRPWHAAMADWVPRPAPWATPAWRNCRGRSARTASDSGSWAGSRRRGPAGFGWGEAVGSRRRHPTSFP
jgi:YVTN family beta-propeller protein